MAGRDGVIGIIGSLWSTDEMLPIGTNLSTGGDAQHCRRDGLVEPSVASNVGIVGIVDWLFQKINMARRYACRQKTTYVVGRWRPNTFQLTLVGAVDRDSLVGDRW